MFLKQVYTMLFDFVKRGCCLVLMFYDFVTPKLFSENVTLREYGNINAQHHSQNDDGFVFRRIESNLKLGNIIA